LLERKRDGFALAGDADRGFPACRITSILSETAGALRGNVKFLQRLNCMACIDG
jgi:hypothetical protein